jgi:hypothetical protein
LRLLIDEMYPGRLAEQLRARGRDAEAVVARPELRGLPDAELFAQAQAEHRAVMTENIADFAVIADAFDARGETHYGLVLVLAGKYPPGDHRTLGKLVTALDSALDEYANDDATSVRHWL